MVDSKVHAVSEKHTKSLEYLYFSEDIWRYNNKIVINNKDSTCVVNINNSTLTISTVSNITNRLLGYVIIDTISKTGSIVRYTSLGYVDSILTIKVNDVFMPLANLDWLNLEFSKHTKSAIIQYTRSFFRELTREFDAHGFYLKRRKRKYVIGYLDNQIENNRVVYRDINQTLRCIGVNLYNHTETDKAALILADIQQIDIHPKVKEILEGLTSSRKNQIVMNNRDINKTDFFTSAHIKQLLQHP